MRTWPALDVDRVNEPDLLQAALVDFGVAAIEEQTPGGLRVYFQGAGERDRALAALATGFPDLALRSTDIEDEDWAARSQALLRAVRVGRLIVAPPWNVPAKPADEPAAESGQGDGPPPVVIVIQPSMGFGTGHHATTRLCLAALQQVDMRGRTVIDIGTGSGVLAIAASLLGAARVVAIDDDPDALEAARDNVRRNGALVDLLGADFRTLALSPFDLVLANLTGGILIGAAGRLQDLAARRGPVIVSGFTRPEEAAVVAAFSRLRTRDRSEEDEWVCLTLQQDSAFE